MSRRGESGPSRVGAATIEGRPELVGEFGDRVLSISAGLGEGAPRSTIELIERWDAVAPDLAALAGSPTAAALDRTSLEWLPPVMPRKLLCVGSNYGDHVDEMARAGVAPGAPVPFPFTFLKPPTTTLVGSGRAVALPPHGERLDWEAELAVVIGAPEFARSEPLRAVFGYTILNDLSLRDFVPFPHALGLDAVICKGFDGAAPIGPWITPAADVEDPGHLPIELRVNGVVKQRSSTEQMLFSVAELVAHYGRVLTLEVGDVIATGTPAGVGAARRPPEFLTAGDEIEIEIGDLGCLRTTMAARVQARALHAHEP